MKRKILILLCLILFIVSVAGVSAVEDVNQTVDENNAVEIIDSDVLYFSEDDSLMDRGSDNELRNLINNAPASSTVELDKDYWGGVEINKALTINGNNFKIYSRGLDCYAQGIVLNKMTFCDMYSTPIYSEVPLTINNCNFVNNSASRHGGGIYSTKDVKLTNCTFSKLHEEIILRVLVQQFTQIQRFF